MPSSAAVSGYCGQRVDSLAGGYPLGNGHRLYNPALMRFTSPDRLSPFDRGGLNTFGYCGGDPVNRSDPSGKFNVGLITQYIFGVSSAVGVANMVLARMRAAINRVALPVNAIEPPLPRLQPAVAAMANTLDAYAYSTSLAIRPFTIRAMSNPQFAAAVAPAVAVADMARATGGLGGYAALPMNLRHEWRRAGVRNMHRGHLVAGAVAEAFGVSYAWQAAQAVGRVAYAGASMVGAGLQRVATGGASLVGGVVIGLRDTIRGRTEVVDLEMGTYTRRY